MADDKEDKEEKQKPEKPRRISGGGDVNLKKIMIIIGGVVVLQVIILIVVFKVFMAPSEPEAAGKNGKDAAKEKASEEVTAEEEAKIKYTSLKFENITTKDFQWYILLQLGFKVVHVPKEGEDEEPEAGGHGGGKAEGYQLPPELISALKSFIIGYFGDMNIEDVQAKHSGMIADLTQKLKPLFKTNNYILKNIALEQFTPVKVN
jgi:hypothetical protein